MLKMYKMLNMYCERKRQRPGQLNPNALGVKTSYTVKPPPKALCQGTKGGFTVRVKIKGSQLS